MYKVDFVRVWEYILSCKNIFFVFKKKKKLTNPNGTKKIFICWINRII